MDDVIRRGLRAAGVMTALAAAIPVFAQTAFPARPIRLIVPFAPGGGTDIVARHIAAKISEGLGQQVVVDNRGGGGGTIGAEMAVRASPDGYTMIMVSASYACNAALYKLPYHPVNDITPVSLIGTSPFLVALHPSVPVKTVRELIDYAKKNPARINFGSTGTGGITHLATEYFKMAAGVNLTHIPYKGTGPAVTDLLGGQIQMIFGAIVSVMPHAKAGKLRGIAVTTPRRINAVPDIPTVAEAGVPGYDAVLWYGIWGPPKLPASIVTRLSAEVKRAGGLQDVRERLASDGFDTNPTTPEDFRKMLSADIDKWTKVVRSAGIKPDS